MKKTFLGVLLDSQYSLTIRVGFFYFYSISRLVGFLLRLRLFYLANYVSDLSGLRARYEAVFPERAK